jgi:hypothetical protein
MASATRGRKRFSDSAPALCDLRPVDAAKRRHVRAENAILSLRARGAIHFFSKRSTVKELCLREIPRASKPAIDARYHGPFCC